MRLWNLVLVALLIGIASAKQQKAAESQESTEEVTRTHHSKKFNVIWSLSDQRVSSTIQKPPTESAHYRKKRGEEVNSEEEGLNSEEVNREFEEYDESSSEEVPDQNGKDEPNEPVNAAEENESTEKVVEADTKGEDTSSSEEIEEQPEIEDNSGEEEDAVKYPSKTPNNNRKGGIDNADAERNVEVEKEPEIKDQEENEENDEEQSKDGGDNGEPEENPKRHPKEDSASEEVEEEPELNDESSEETEDAASENSELNQDNDKSADVDVNNKESPAEQEDSEEIEPEDELEDESSEEEVVKDVRNNDEVKENQKQGDEVKEEERHEPEEENVGEQSNQDSEEPTPTYKNDIENGEAEIQKEEAVEQMEKGESSDSMEGGEQNTEKPVPTGDTTNFDAIAAESDLESVINEFNQPTDEEKEFVTNVREKIIEQAEKAFAEMMKQKSTHEGSTNRIEQAKEATEAKEATVSDSETLEETAAEESAPVDEVKSPPPMTHVEIRAAIIAEAEKAYKNVIQKTDKDAELKAEPKLNETEEKEIRKLMTTALEKKEEALVDKEEKAEEESLVKEITSTSNLMRLKRAAKVLAEDPTVQPAGAFPVELPTETKDSTGKNETLPAAIEKDVPKKETVKQELANEKFTDGFGWVHYPWKQFPVRKKRFHYEKQCGCEVIWIKKVYTRPQPKSKLLLVKSSYIHLKKPRRLCKKRLPVIHSVQNDIIHSAPKPCKRLIRRKNQFSPKSIRRFHGTNFAEQSWRKHLTEKKTTILEGKKSFAKRFEMEGQTPINLRFARKVSLRHHKIMKKNN